MQLIEVQGDARTIGRQVGEATRDEIARHIELYPPAVDWPEWERRRDRFLPAVQRLLPRVFDEMVGTAEGANIDFDAILQLNLPLYEHQLYDEPQAGGSIAAEPACTNVVFASGGDGPLLGKNNDSLINQKSRPVVAKLVRRNDSIPVLQFIYAGMLGLGDGMNAEGVAFGHS